MNDQVEFYIGKVKCWRALNGSARRTQPQAETRRTTDQVEQLGPGLGADVQQVLEGLGDQESRLLALPLQQGIGRHRRAHSDPANQGGVHRLVPGKGPPCFLQNNSGISHS